MKYRGLRWGLFSNDGGWEMARLPWMEKLWNGRLGLEKTGIHSLACSFGLLTWNRSSPGETGWGGCRRAEPQGWVAVLSAVIGVATWVISSARDRAQNSYVRETFHKSLRRRMLPSIELLKRCLLFMGMNSENKYAHSKRDRHKCGVFFNYICSLLNITDTASLSV